MVDRIDVPRTPFQIAHMTFEIGSHPETGPSFVLRTPDAPAAKDRKPLFTGFLSADTAREMRAAADFIDQTLEAWDGMDA